MNEFDPNGTHEEEVCPICGGKIDYLAKPPQYNFPHLEWECRHCRATGASRFTYVFVNHFNVLRRLEAETPKTGVIKNTGEHGKSPEQSLDSTRSNLI